MVVQILEEDSPGENFGSGMVEQTRIASMAPKGDLCWKCTMAPEE